MKKINLEKLQAKKTLTRSQLKVIDGGYEIPRNKYIPCWCGPIETGTFGGFVNSASECFSACS